MSDYVVTMGRSPGLTDMEIRRRLHAVYSLLIAFGREAQGQSTTDDVEIGDQTQLAAGDESAIDGTHGAG